MLILDLLGLTNRAAHWRRDRLASVIQSLLCLLPAAFGSANASARQAATPPLLAGTEVFVENIGQWPESVLYLGRMGGLDVRIERDGVWIQTWTGVESRDRTPATFPIDLDLQSSRFADARLQAFRISIEGMGSCVVRGEQETPGLYSFLDADPARSVPGAHGFARVRLDDVLPGVDWVWMRDEQGRPRFDFELDSGIDPREIEIRIDGPGKLRESQGRIELVSVDGSLTIEAPRSYQERQDGRLSVESLWRLDEHGALHLEIGHFDPTIPLVVDPSILYSTYVGGTDQDSVEDIDVFSDGSWLLVGETYSPNFPTTPGVFDEVADGPFLDVFVVRIADDGASPVYSTVVGGDSGGGLGKSVVCAADGESPIVAYMCGEIAQSTPGAYVTPTFPSGSTDLMVTKLNADATALEFSARLGGSLSELPIEVLVDSQARLVLCGVAQRADFPTTLLVTGKGPQQGGASFIARLSQDGSALLDCIVVDTDKAENFLDFFLTVDDGVVAAGLTNDEDFPTTPGAFQEVPLPPGGPGQTATTNGLLMRFPPTFDAVDYATLISSSLIDEVWHVEPAGPNAFWLVLRAEGKDIPFPPGFDVGELDPGIGPYAVMLWNAVTNEPVLFRWVTFQIPSAATIDADGGLVLLTTTTPDAYFPFLDPGQPFGPPGRLTVIKLDPLAEQVVFAYAYGGSQGASTETYILPMHGLPIGPEQILVTGITTVPDILLTPDAVDPFSFDASQGEGFVTLFDLEPTGVTRYGAPTDACNGPMHLGLRDLPVVGSATFGLACVAAPPSAAGVLAIAPTPLEPPLPILGADLHVDLAGALLIPVAADALGRWGTDLPLTTVPAGATVAFQTAWIDPGTCGTPGTLSASDALLVTVQP